MIAGNHDSPVRLQYLNGLIGRVGARCRGRGRARAARVTLTGRDGVPVTFWPLAYTDPETARYVLGRDDIHTHEAVLAAQLESIRARIAAGGAAAGSGAAAPGGAVARGRVARAGAPGDRAARHVIVGHAFVTGAATSESERPLSVGGSGEVSHEVFDGFDYVALGHLHRPQRVSERVRYAGSLLEVLVRRVRPPQVGDPGRARRRQGRVGRGGRACRCGTTSVVSRAPSWNSRSAPTRRRTTMSTSRSHFSTVRRCLTRWSVCTGHPHPLNATRGGDCAAASTAAGGPETMSELFARFYGEVTRAKINEAQQAEVVAALESSRAREERVAS